MWIFFPIRSPSEKAETEVFSKKYNGINICFESTIASWCVWTEKKLFIYLENIDVLAHIFFRWRSLWKQDIIFQPKLIVNLAHFYLKNKCLWFPSKNRHILDTGIPCLLSIGINSLCKKFQNKKIVQFDCT